MVTFAKFSAYKHSDIQCFGVSKEIKDLELMISGEWYPVDYERLKVLQPKLSARIFDLVWGQEGVATRKEVEREATERISRCE